MRSLLSLWVDRFLPWGRIAATSPASRKHGSVIAVLFWAFFLVLPIPSMVHGEESAPVPSATGAIHDVRMPRDVLAFEPALLRIRPGDTVKWTNEGDKVHVFASIPGSGTNDKEIFSPMVKPGETWSHTFEKAGDYPYFCFIHNQMLGAIVVEETPSPTPGAP